MSSSQERIEQAKADWRAGRMKLPYMDDKEFIPLPAVASSLRTQPPPERLVDGHERGRCLRVALCEAVLHCQRIPFCFQHVDEVRQATLEPLTGQVCGSLARSWRLLSAGRGGFEPGRR